MPRVSTSSTHTMRFYAQPRVYDADTHQGEESELTRPDLTARSRSQ
jgi:hypothetical protein